MKNATTKRTPAPQAPELLDSERGLAGSLLLDADRVLRLARAAGITVDHFSDETSRRVFGAVVRLADAGRPVEPAAVQREAGLDVAAVQKLIDDCPTTAHAGYHLTVIRGAAVKRAVLTEVGQAEGVEALRLALRKAEGLLPAAGGAAAVSLADLPPPMPESDNPAALFRGGWLRKGGGAFLISTSGAGKSVWTVQAAVLWALGLPAFGVEPVRPLRVGIIQAEDDQEEMADFREQIRGGLAGCGLDLGQIEAATRDGVQLFDAVGAVGEAFIAKVGEILRAHAALDLLIINPFHSFFGGDVSRNAELSAFLRAGLDPVIKPSRVGVLFVHHTNKPPSAKDRQGWGADSFTAYLGAGGAELVNWPRAVLALMPCENAPGVFRLVAGKRGQRLNWTDASGARTTTRFIAHSADRIFWRDATAEEIEAAQGSQGGAGNRKGDPQADAAELALQAQARAWKLTDLRAYAVENFGSGRGRRAFDFLKANAAAHHLAVRTARHKGASFIGTRPEAEAAAQAWDSKAEGAA